MFSLHYKGVYLCCIFRARTISMHCIRNDSCIRVDTRSQLLDSNKRVDALILVLTMWLSCKMWFGTVFSHTKCSRSLAAERMTWIIIQRICTFWKTDYLKGQGFCTWMVCSENCLKLVLFPLSVGLSNLVSFQFKPIQHSLLAHKNPA